MIWLFKKIKNYFFPQKKQSGDQTLECYRKSFHITLSNEKKQELKKIRTNIKKIKQAYRKIKGQTFDQVGAKLVEKLALKNQRRNNKG